MNVHYSLHCTTKQAYDKLWCPSVAQAKQRKVLRYNESLNTWTKSPKQLHDVAAIEVRYLKREMYLRNATIQHATSSVSYHLSLSTAT